MSTANAITTRYPVPSETVPNLTYLVGIDVMTDLYTCTCPDHTYRHRDCKHIRRVQARSRMGADRALATAREG